MRIGIVAYWFNRGQGVVARQLRAALDALGHETFVLARPTRETNIRPSWIDSEGVWDQPRITAASSYDVPWEDYADWAEANGPDVVMFDQNYGFDEISRLRESGVRTIGRFVWEQFSPQHVPAAQRAFDVIYSLTACERQRYGELGIESPRVRWGIHPDLLAYAPDLRRGAAGAAPGEADPAVADAGAGQEARDGQRPEREDVHGGSGADGGLVTFFFPGGFMSKRKPIKEVLSAFRAAGGDQLRLLMKAQVSRRVKPVEKAAKRDPRIEVIWDELPTDDYLRLFASADVCLAPSRWEGLGLHLYEATAFGLPIITNDAPPMNETVVDGENGLLVASVTDGEARSGIPAMVPDVDSLRDAIERLADGDVRAALGAGALRRADQLSWSTTIADLERLLEGV